MVAQPDEDDQAADELNGGREQREWVATYDDDGVLTVEEISADVQPIARRNLAIWCPAWATNVPMWFTVSAAAAGAITR
jgi:hypothetical protein